MVEKLLGKITFAEFGTIHDMPFLFGLQLGFNMGKDGSVMDGGRYTINISPECKWGSLEERNARMFELMREINQILEDAKVHRVSDLIGKPVEVTLDRNCFSSFRILTEVL